MRTKYTFHIKQVKIRAEWFLHASDSLEILLPATHQEIASASSSDGVSGQSRHFVELEETSREFIVQVVEYNAVHRESSEDLVQVDVVVMPLEQPLVDIVSIDVPQSSGNM